MTKPTTKAGGAATGAKPLLQFEVTLRGHEPVIILAHDFEVDGDGLYFIDNPGTEDALVHAFCSHPALVAQHRPTAETAA